ncbi:hypothetical protein JW756_03740 [Candidatus Woesearchaeota archaeon]|nr:hypothetical protein [Candidatus Woesearchaeota archaeon]
MAKRKAKTKTCNPKAPKFEYPKSMTIKGVTLQKVTLERLINLKKSSSRYGWRIKQLTDPVLIPVPVGLDGNADLEKELNEHPEYFKGTLQKANAYMAGKPGYTIHYASMSSTHPDFLVSKLYLPIILYKISK